MIYEALETVLDCVKSYIWLVDYAISALVHPTLQ